MDFFDALLLTVKAPHSTSATAHAAPVSSGAELDLSYSLAKRVPDMERGFTISTSYGDIVIEPGRHADAIASAVRRSLEIQLRAAELARRDTEMDTAALSTRAKGAVERANVIVEAQFSTALKKNGRPA